MEEISKDPLGHIIYGRVCDDLVSGRLRPNQKITIRGLANVLGTSSTPVRDAVQRLLQDNALEQRSVRDVRVPVLTKQQYLEIASVRVELEGLAAATAAGSAQGKDVTRLKRIIARNEEAIATERWPLAAEMNQKFHFALAEIANMPILRDVLSRLWLRMGPLIAGYYGTAQEDMVQHHHAIVTACRSRDPEAARAAMQADIEGAREGITDYLKALAKI
ncbi:GntR family transcriptional regulator [Pseudorhodobacter sp.]|uniref:GntR family transcriptional regulator n=1 Tax=Pseudorhodobacter sp. TaxID=1934400 RepID=UPI0026482B99|nr:GntR family transcriptional regulator [Pseudorhodobacter sp.]MDN5785550.1 GntR family transcriptional regulator [Pseudorhodobacter sp.]